MPEADDRVRLEWDREGVAVLTVTGPPPNPMTFACVDALADRLDDARTGGARVVVIASDVPGYWLGHASLRDLAALVRREIPNDTGGGFFRAADALSREPMVSIAAISGDTAGGGCELGWSCDLRVAERSARFAQMEVLAGLIPGLGGIARLSRLIGRTATSEIVLDGARIGAAPLDELGAINRLVPDGRATEVAIAWARRLAARPPEALALAKQVLAESAELPLGESLANEQRRFQSILATPAALALMDATQAEYDAGDPAPASVVLDGFDPLGD